MRKLYYAALTYMVLGLAAGLFYREYTKTHAFTGDTQLSVMHTHLLTLGMLTFLVVLAFDGILELSTGLLFTLFYWFYNAGLLITVSMLLVHGMLTVQGAEVSSAIPGIAGLGHILLAVGLVHLFLQIRRRLMTVGWTTRRQSPPSRTRPADPARSTSTPARTA